MEAIVNLIVPETEKLDFDIMKDIEVVPRPRDPYRYKGKFYNAVDAVAAKVAFEVGLKGLNVTPQEINDKFNKFLNPPIGFKTDDYVYDMDLHLNPDKTDTDYYIHKYNYQGSCPHANSHPTRHTTEGMVSCFTNNLRIYTKIMTWYKANYNDLPYKSIKRMEPVPKNTHHFDYMRTIVENLIFKNKIDIYNIMTVIDNYFQGISEGYHLNTLTRKRLYFDLYSWIEVENEYGQLKVLQRADNIYNKIITDVPPSLNSIVELVLNDKYQKEEADAIRRAVEEYFANIELYSNHIYNISESRWELVQNNVEFTAPMIIGFNTLDERTSVAVFKDIITKINNINNLRKAVVG